MSETTDLKDNSKSVYNAVGSLAIATAMLTSCGIDKNSIQDRKDTDIVPLTPNSTETTNQNFSTTIPFIPEGQAFPFKAESFDSNTKDETNDASGLLLNKLEEIQPIQDLTNLESPIIEYTETIVEIEGQAAYIAVPSEINPNNPPKIVMFNHGSNTRVTADTTDQFMIDLKEYAELFTSNNFIFCASNAHGENWGNAESIRDNSNMISWVRDNYKTNPEIYIIGFSMGGLTSMRYVRYHPENVVRIALLAPTTSLYDWNSNNINILENIDIKIWHGIDDHNISISNSIDFINRMENYGKTIPLVQIPNKTHFDIDTERKEDILNYFLGNSKNIKDF